MNADLIPLPRVLEVEVMDTAEEAADYDSMDHRAVNQAFVSDLLDIVGEAARPWRCLDVGTGTARIAIELAMRAPHVHVVGEDLAEHMLALARCNVEASGLSDRIALRLADAKQAEGACFDVVVSNTVLHHIPVPAMLLAAMWARVAPGGTLFLRDLSRPQTEAELHALVVAHGGDPQGGEAVRRQNQLFADSLRASLNLGEVLELCTQLQLPVHALAMSSDRHWTLVAHKR